ncbi:MAG TPA: monovalent cation/H+ antiporter complex subunit F, partial [Promineifilum sp.]|nr:monovalent cation/H+ antiporter complex subunit F [Promineifilum sp.]
MVELLSVVAGIAMILHVGMLAIVVWRIWRGDTVVDRLIGVDLITTLLISILVLLSITQRDSIYIDLALALAALGF